MLPPDRHNLLILDLTWRRHLDDLPTRQMGAAISDLTPAHVEFLSHAGVGEALAVVGNDVYVMTVESNPKELRALRGS